MRVRVRGGGCEDPGTPTAEAWAPGRRADGREALEALREGGPWKSDGGGRRWELLGDLSLEDEAMLM